MFEILGLVASGVSAAGRLSAGIAAREEAKLNAFQMETQKKENKVAAFQQARARREEYDLATSANIAAFAAQGRDIGADRSVEAFLERQKEIVGEDIGRIARQVRSENLRADMMAMAERRRGRNAFYSSLFSAVGTMGQGIAEYGRTRS